MNGYDGRTGGTRNADMDLERIRGKWKPAFDKICDTFDAPMEHYCEVLAQHVMRFQEEKADIFTDVVKTESEERAHMALDEMLNDLMPLSLRRLIALVGIDSTPVPEPTSVPQLPSLPSPSISETSVPDTRAAARTSTHITTAGTRNSGLTLADVDVNAQATATSPSLPCMPVQQPQRLMSTFYTAHPSSLFSVPNERAGENMHTLSVRPQRSEALDIDAFSGRTTPLISFYYFRESTKTDPKKMCPESSRSTTSSQYRQLL